MSQESMLHIWWYRQPHLEWDKSPKSRGIGLFFLCNNLLWNNFLGHPSFFCSKGKSLESVNLKVLQSYLIDSSLSCSSLWVLEWGWGKPRAPRKEISCIVLYLCACFAYHCIPYSWVSLPESTGEHRVNEYMDFTASFLLWAVSTGPSDL